MIEKAPTLKISGKKYDFYYVDFQNNGSRDPSTMTIGYVLPNSATGIALSDINNEHMPIGADDAELTEVKVYKHGSSTPSFAFKGYPVSSRISKSPGRNELQVRYIDESVILDRKYVGLKGKFGPGFESVTWGNFDDIILVGEQVNPCEQIGDGTTAADRCSPCTKGNDLNQQIIDCNEALQYEIRDVVYNFGDLISALSNNIGSDGKIKVEKLPNSKLNNSYYARYTGTIREVLSNWCNDFGLGFYWDYDFGLRFVDLKSGVNINDSSIRGVSCKILGYTDEISIENNVSSKVITYFGENGKKLPYDCNSSVLKSLSLKPLLLESLVTDIKGDLDPQILKTYKTLDNFYQCCMYSSFSPVLRDLFVLSEIYGIKSAKDFENYIYTETGEDKKKDDKILFLLGNMKVKSFLDEKDSPEDYEKTAYEFFLDQFPAEKRAYMKKKGVYFIIAERSDEVYERTIKGEAALGSNFIGQHWYRFYSTSHRSVSPQINSPGDGSPTYYRRGDELQFDFLKDLPLSRKYLKNFIQKDKKKSDANAATNGDKSRDNFIYMKRAAAWVPEQNSIEIANIIESISYLELANLGNEQFLNLFGKNDFCFSVFPAEYTFEGELTGFENPIDKEKKNQVYKQGNGIYSYGLRSSKCGRYTFKIKENKELKEKSVKLEIYTPSQSFKTVNRNFEGIDEGPDERFVTHAGYKIFIEEAVGFSDEVLSKKKEMVYGISGNKNNSVRLNLNYRNATQDLLRLLNNNPSLVGEKYFCEYSEDSIKEFVEEFADKLGVEDPIQKRVVQYQIGGFFPTKLGMKDGVDQISIRLDGQEGFKTYISFSNLPKRRINEVISIKEFEKYLALSQINHKTKFDTEGVAPQDII